MKKNLLWLAGAAVAMALTSCYYDPYYGGGGSTSVSYSSGYGDGYGYGGSSFNTSVFVSTGNARWGYDPYCYSYYDYHTRRYYDPYLYGYYPVGYRPPVVYGVPHPYGYRRGYCPPPSRVTNVYVSNYRNREYRYRNTSYGWAKQVRQQSPNAGRPQGSRPAQSYYDRQGQGPNQGRPNNASRPSNSRESQFRNQQRESSRPAARQQQNSRQPSRYNTPVNVPQQQRQQAQRQASSQQRQQAQRQAMNQQRQQAQRQAQRQPQQGGGGQRQGEKEGKRMQGYR